MRKTTRTMAHKRAKSGKQPRDWGKQVKKNGGVSAQAKVEKQSHVKAHILIAEDEPGIAEALALIVAEVGYIPLVAPDGQQALALARRTPPDLVFTDLRMPHLDGAGLIAALREDAVSQGRSAPPIVLMTAFRRLPDQAIAVDALIFKPFAMAEVLQLLERFLPAAP